MNILGTVVVKECILLTETVFEANRQRHGWRGSFESARKAARVSQPPPPHESTPNTNPDPGPTLVLFPPCRSNGGEGALYAWVLTEKCVCDSPAPILSSSTVKWLKIRPPKGKGEVAPWALARGSPGSNSSSPGPGGGGEGGGGNGGGGEVGGGEGGGGECGGGTGGGGAGGGGVTLRRCSQ